MATCPQQRLCSFSIGRCIPDLGGATCLQHSVRVSQPTLLFLIWEFILGRRPPSGSRQAAISGRCGDARYKRREPSRCCDADGAGDWRPEDMPNRASQPKLRPKASDQSMLIRLGVMVGEYGAGRSQTGLERNRYAITCKRRDDSKLIPHWEDVGRDRP